MRRNLWLMSSVLSTLLTVPAFAQNVGDGAEAVAPADPSEEALEAAPVAPPEERPAPVFASGSDVSYDLQLHGLEDRLNELREDVLGSKARLRMLWHQLMQERIGGSRLILNHVNEMGSLLELVQVTYTVDGRQVFARSISEDPELDRHNEFEISADPILAGPHTIVVQVELRGNDRGMFSYMNGYRFQLTSSQSFTIEDGKTAEVDVILFDQGGASAPIEERPDIEYRMEFTDTVDETVEGTDGDA
jgi:hypothetical protein